MLDTHIQREHRAGKGCLAGTLDLLPDMACGRSTGETRHTHGPTSRSGALFDGRIARCDAYGCITMKPVLFGIQPGAGEPHHPYRWPLPRKSPKLKLALQACWKNSQTSNPLMRSPGPRQVQDLTKVCHNHPLEREIKDPHTTTSLLPFFSSSLTPPSPHPLSPPSRRRRNRQKTPSAKQPSMATPRQHHQHPHPNLRNHLLGRA